MSKLETRNRLICVVSPKSEPPEAMKNKVYMSSHEILGCFVSWQKIPKKSQNISRWGSGRLRFEHHSHDLFQVSIPQRKARSRRPWKFNSSFMAATPYPPTKTQPSSRGIGRRSDQLIYGRSEGWSKCGKGSSVDWKVLALNGVVLRWLSPWSYGPDHRIAGTIGDPISPGTRFLK